MVGVTSYLLINFWYTRLYANRASMQAILVNRIGDWGYSLGLFTLLPIFYSLDMGNLFSTIHLCNREICEFITLLFFIGAIGKSAQLFLHHWLPNAMEAYNIKLFILLYIINYLYFNNLNIHDNIFLFSNNIIITNYQKQAITGLLLSDGHLRNPNLNKRTSGNYRLEFTFKPKDFTYWLKFDILKTICTNTLPTPYPKFNPTQYWFSTRNHIYFTEIYKDWYIIKNNMNIKILPLNLINIFSDVTLAFCIMGDGHWDKSNKTVILCTECYTLLENKKLIDILYKNFNLNAYLVKKNKYYYRIKFNSNRDNIKLLKYLVKPHFHYSMLYKLGE